MTSPSDTDLLSFRGDTITILSRAELMDALVAASRRIDQLTAERNELDRRLMACGGWNREDKS